jgi:DNA or RNA helicases of superfamily II
MNKKTQIKTTKTIYPQIYAYTLPQMVENDGWIKIGYTEREFVDERIIEQTKTAAINLEFCKLWSEPAKFSNSNDWFKDKQFHAYLRKFKNVNQRKNTEWFFYNGTPEEAHSDFEDFIKNEHSQVFQELDYQLRSEQEEAVEKTLTYLNTHSNGKFLWNAKPRFGKTLTTYDLARKMDAVNVLIVTNRPAIANSWFDDFEKFIAWQTNYKFVSTSDSLKDRPVLTRNEYVRQLEEDTHQIAFISLQDLKGAISFGGTYDKLRWVKDLRWDLLVIDEAHEGIDTIKTDVAFKEIKRGFTLHLSGTPFKAVASGKFTENQIFNWTYADEQNAKLEWQNTEENNPYEKLPKLNLFSYQMSQMITDDVNKGAEIDGNNIDYAFDLNEFFDTKENGDFTYENDVKRWLDTLTHNEKYPFSTKELRAELKHTFWLLNRVDSAKALQKLLRNHPVFENYKIVLAAGDGKGNDDQVINEKSLVQVRKAIKNNNKTITLSVGQLTTGVTVPEWTAVVMLSNIKSSSLYMQAAFRAQNSWDYVVEGKMQQKENAYIFDFAPERTLTIYDEFANNLSSKTSNGNGTTDERKNNIRELLNFFPVIAEDSDGKMVELDVNQVLTIPKAIKAQEVVKRGFMSNLLFQNITNIFATSDVKEILEQLNPVDIGKSTPRKTAEVIDTKDIQVDNKGEVIINPEIIIAENDARFGEKVYKAVGDSVAAAIDNEISNLTNVVAKSFINSTKDTAKELAKEQGLTNKQGEQVVKKNADVIAHEVEIIQRQAEIKQAEAKVEYDKIMAHSQNNVLVMEEAKSLYEAKSREIEDNFKKEVVSTVETKTRELTEKTTETILKKAKDKEKNTVEDDVRARLRGFARTIPSFLMAYGESTTTLANFDMTIKNEVFKEVTGITLDQFRTLRDEHKFFDDTVFNESVQEFLNKRIKLANYFDETQEEDIFDYIPPQKTNQIYTPKKVVKMMIDKLQEENPDDFKNPNKTFVDLYMKSGLYITEIIKRLYVGLEEIIPNDDERLKHILEHQVYGFAPTEIIYNIAHNFIFGFNEVASSINDSHIIFLDTTSFARGNTEISFEDKCEKLFGGEEMKFDVVVGNPPYQDENVGNNKQATPIYNFFYELAESIASKYSLISPARFLSNQGATPKVWNKKMLNDEYLKIEYFNAKSNEVFPGVDIKGGVVVIYRDENKKYGAIDTFIPFEELRGIYSKVISISLNNLSSLVYSPDSYRFTDKIFIDNPQLKGRTDDSHAKAISSSVFDRYGEVFYDNEPIDDYEYIQIYGRQNGKRINKYIKREYVAPHPNLDKWKIFVPGANGTGAIGEVISTPVIGHPVIGHNQTFVSLGSFDTKFEAEALLKYIKSKFGRVMLGIMKTTQNNQSKNTWSKVPLQDFTKNSDIDWMKSIFDIDKQLYKKYDLNKDEIAFIEGNVREME